MSPAAAFECDKVAPIFFFAELLLLFCSFSSLSLFVGCEEKCKALFNVEFSNSDALSNRSKSETRRSKSDISPPPLFLPLSLVFSSLLFALTTLSSIAAFSFVANNIFLVVFAAFSSPSSPSFSSRGFAFDEWDTNFFSNCSNLFNTASMEDVDPCSLSLVILFLFEPFEG